MSGLEQISPYLTGPQLVAALAAFGFLVGVLTGLFGVAGGFLIVPLLNLLFGIDWRLAIGSSLAFTIGTSAAGVVRHMRLRNVEPRSTLIMGAAAVVGAVLGAQLLSGLKTALGRSGSDTFDLLIQGLFVGVLLLTAALIFRRAGEQRAGAALLQRLPLPPRVDLAHGRLKGVSLAGLCLVALLVGVFTGLLGIGGGVLFMPVLILAVGLPAHQAVGTSLGIILCGSVAGTVKHATAAAVAHATVGNVSLPLAMLLLVGSTVGVQLGAWCCHRLHAKQLRQYFGIIVFLAAVALAADLAAKLAPHLARR